MIDISDVKVEEYTVEDAKVYAVLPKSDMKTVFIPSPPTTTVVPTNPRNLILAITDKEVTDEVKAYAKENKIVFLFTATTDTDEICEIFKWAMKESKNLNIKKTGAEMKADEDKLDAANEAVEALEDDDIEIDEAEVFELE